tara:strand:+ start:39 stop:332 length:294 start_codon:yes stop_codon:yes gene_type:complete
MKISTLLFASSFLLIGCSEEIPTHTGPVDTSSDTPFEDVCSSEPDDCHEQACQQCNDSCEEPCDVMESWPQQYGCAGGDTVTVYEVCPDWDDDYSDI